MPSTTDWNRTLRRLEKSGDSYNAMQFKLHMQQHFYLKNQCDSLKKDIVQWKEEVKAAQKKIKDSSKSLQGYKEAVVTIEKEMKSF